MRREFSEASLQERKVGLWTPWGVLRLDDRDADKHRDRRPAPPPCADDRHAGRRAALRLARHDFDPRA